MGEPRPQRKKRWRLEMARAQRFRCVYCGNKFPLEQLTFDHVKALKDGGTWGRYNLVLACSFCNNSRNATFMAEQRRIKESGLTVREYRRRRHHAWLQSEDGRQMVDGLIADGRHEAAHRLVMRYGEPPSTNAVDPSAADPGTLPTRAEKASS